MTRRIKKLLIAALIVTLGGILGYSYDYFYQLQHSKPRMVAQGEARLPQFSFPDVEGNQRSSDEWRDKVVVVNFWATWCPPCRKEMPLFIELQEKYAGKGLQFVAIAIDDPDLVQDFYDVYGINFPTLIGGPEAIKLANRLGNRFDSLPFTAIFDRDGNTHYIQAGEMTKTILEQQLIPLL
jgi:thiol-disulfide isomerase/thioredoxin